MGGGGGNSEVSQSSLSSDYAFCCQDAKTGRTSGGKDGDERWGLAIFLSFLLARHATFLGQLSKPHLDNVSALPCLSHGLTVQRICATEQGRSDPGLPI